MYFNTQDKQAMPRMSAHEGVRQASGLSPNSIPNRHHPQYLTVTHESHTAR